MFDSIRRARTHLAVMDAVLPAAERLAHADGIPQPGAEHLLLGALELPDGIARRALDAVGCDSGALQAALTQGHAAALRAVGVHADDEAIGAAMPAPTQAKGPLRSQGSLQTALQRAVELAKDDGVSLGSGHLLLAVIEPERGTLAGALTRLGVDRAVLRAEVQRLLAR